MHQFKNIIPTVAADFIFVIVIRLILFVVYSMTVSTDYTG
jgi:hypothetical protein